MEKEWKELEEACRLRKEKVIDVRNVSVRTPMGIVENKELVKMTPFFLKNLCNIIGAPYSFFIKCDEDLEQRIMDAFLPKQNEYKFLMVNKELQNLLYSEYPYFSTEQILNVVQMISKKNKVQILEDEKRGLVVINIASEEKERELKAGDVVRRGVTIRSQISSGRQFIFSGPFLLRLVCTNGMIRREDSISLLKFQAKDSEELIRSKLSEDFGEVEFFENLKSLQNKNIEQPGVLISRLAREVSIGRARDIIIDRLATIEPNAFEAVNLLSSYANEVGNLSEMRNLQLAAGTLVSTFARRCQKCGYIIH